LAKYGPAALPEEKRRIVVSSFSISNKNDLLLDRFRHAFEMMKGRPPLPGEMEKLARSLAYESIGAYCEGAERAAKGK
jgi:hypothetical protein